MQQDVIINFTLTNFTELVQVNCLVYVYTMSLPGIINLTECHTAVGIIMLMSHLCIPHPHLTHLHNFYTHTNFTNINAHTHAHMNPPTQYMGDTENTQHRMQTSPFRATVDGDARRGRRCSSEESAGSVQNMDHSEYLKGYQESTPMAPGQQQM